MSGSHSFEVREINESLLNLFGRHLTSDRQVFRLVWANDQTERRFGTFNVFAGDLFLREETGVRTVSKYPQYENQYIVEKLHENLHQDVMEGSHSYEPIFTFPIGLPPKFEAVEKVVRTILGHIAGAPIPKTEKEALYQDNELKKQEVKEARHQLDEISSPSEIQLAFEAGDAISLAGAKHGEVDNS